MDYRKLGSTGTAVSTIALGAMYFGDETPEEEAFAILDAYLDAGGNLIDTSNVYVGGLSEEIIGRWFARRPREVTDRVVMTTKGRFSTDPDVNGPRAVSPIPQPFPRRVLAPARPGEHRPVPAARLGPADAGGRNTLVPRLRRTGGQDPVRGAVELHRMAATTHGGHRTGD